MQRASPRYSSTLHRGGLSTDELGRWGRRACPPTLNQIEICPPRIPTATATTHVGVTPRAPAGRAIALIKRPIFSCPHFHVLYAGSGHAQSSFLRSGPLSTSFHIITICEGETRGDSELLSVSPARRPHRCHCREDTRSREVPRCLLFATRHSTSGSSAATYFCSRLYSPLLSQSLRDECLQGRSVIASRQRQKHHAQIKEDERGRGREGLLTLLFPPYFRSHRRFLAFYIFREK